MITFQKPTTPSPSHLETDPVRRMAVAMRELAFSGRVVDREALSLRGFTSAEIDQHGIEARDMAYAMGREAA
ncbi:hypothetical protein [Nitratireductor luteus]|uniref:hypothetical protein n=1 Tax=Nitratireductor luteus TaxID=2976980 RepID=UPI00223EAF09|nr:hypothetical protein [Nitratireductor luteus]